VCAESTPWVERRRAGRQNAYWRMETTSMVSCTEVGAELQETVARQARRPQPIAAPFPGWRKVALPPGHYSFTQKTMGLPLMMTEAGLDVAHNSSYILLIHRLRRRGRSTALPASRLT